MHPDSRRPFHCPAHSLLQVHVHSGPPSSINNPAALERVIILDLWLAEGNDLATKLSLPSHKLGVHLFLRLFTFSPVLSVKSTKFLHEAPEYLLG